MVLSAMGSQLGDSGFCCTHTWKQAFAALIRGNNCNTQLVIHGHFDCWKKKVNTPNCKPHVGIKILQVLGSLVYGIYLNDQNSVTKRHNVAN